MAKKKKKRNNRSVTKALKRKRAAVGGISVGGMGNYQNITSTPEQLAAQQERLAELQKQIDNEAAAKAKADAQAAADAQAKADAQDKPGPGPRPLPQRDPTARQQQAISEALGLSLEEVQAIPLVDAKRLYAMQQRYQGDTQWQKEYEILKGNQQDTPEDWQSPKLPHWWYNEGDSSKGFDDDVKHFITIMNRQAGYDWDGSGDGSYQIDQGGLDQYNKWTSGTGNWAEETGLKSIFQLIVFLKLKLMMMIHNHLQAMMMMEILILIHLSEQKELWMLLLMALLFKSGMVKSGL